MLAYLQAHSTNVLNALVLGLVILLAYQSAQITLSALTPLEVTSVNRFEATSANETRRVPSINHLLAQNIFGEAGKVEFQEPEPTVDAPETKLSLELQGVSVGKSDDSSTAIISETSSGAGEIYWIGDSIAGKAILSAVYEDRVVIKQAGRLETLRFSDDFQSAGGLTRNSPIPSVSNVTPTHSDVLRSYRARKNDKDSMIRELGSALNDINKGNFQTFDTLLDEYGANMQKNIEEAARFAGLEDADGGMKVGSRAQQSWTNRVGLKQGDIVKSVNQYSLQTLKSDRSAIDSVIKSCVARIEVQRGPNTFVVTYPFCK